ncbi:hypothetical protein HCN44_010151 [Aphidius gifuensis]|uniref:Uncharacterized protein n=1 Tax=Aphidius gifuensis TaxID=684658 RepID=A0A834XZ70_APHGI|nr:hypothetical protein HCN44_010151 [Aphidius gifuensis]
MPGTLTYPMYVSVERPTPRRRSSWSYRRRSSATQVPPIRPERVSLAEPFSSCIGRREVDGSHWKSFSSTTV